MAPNKGGPVCTTTLSILTPAGCVTSPHVPCLASVSFITALRRDRSYSRSKFTALSQFASFPDGQKQLLTYSLCCCHAFFPCLLLGYSHWSLLLSLPRQTLPVCHLVHGLCSLSALPVTSHSSLNVKLNAGWGPVLITWLLYIQINRMFSLLGVDHFIDMLWDSDLVLHVCHTALLAYKADWKTCQHCCHCWATTLICLSLSVCTWPVVSCLNCKLRSRACLTGL